MFRKYMIFILAAFMIVGTSACTSKQASDEAEMEQSTGDELEAATENSDGLSTDDGGAIADLGGVNDDLAPEEKLPDDKATAPADGDLAAAVDEASPPADQAAADVPPPVADEAVASEPAPPPEPAMDAAGTTPAEPAPPSEPMSPPVPEPVAEAKPVVASLQKVKTAPWKQGKLLVNAIYFARSGDTPDSISQKVFGSKDKVKELCRVNSYNCSRPTKVGDKFYYQSPQRPTDDTTVKTFYEDAGIAPQMYTAVEGDNIRKVAKTLLGDDNSWKEIWSTNDVESKQGLDAGTQLKYWPDAPAAPEQTMAQTEEPPAPPADPAMTEPPPAMPDTAQQPPPMPDQAAEPPPPPPPPADLPPAPDQNQNAAATTAPPEPPAPPPPPPMEQQAAHSAPAGLDAGAQDPNQTMALGVGAVLLLAAAALFISIRKKRARRQIDFNTTTQTQIE